MALRQIIKEPDEFLRKKCRKVEKIDERILTLLGDMAETMYASDGVGLAAPQVGILKRVVVIDVGDEMGLIELINPEIISVKGEQINDEGCLSVVGRRGMVKRPAKVVARALDRDGNLMEYTARGLLAVAFCHEIDHLDGVLFIDKIVEETENA